METKFVPKNQTIPDVVNTASGSAMKFEGKLEVQLRAWAKKHNIPLPAMGELLDLHSAYGVNLQADPSEFMNSPAKPLYPKWRKPVNPTWYPYPEMETLRELYSRKYQTPLPRKEAETSATPRSNASAAYGVDDSGSGSSAPDTGCKKSSQRTLPSKVQPMTAKWKGIPNPTRRTGSLTMTIRRLTFMLPIATTEKFNVLEKSLADSDLRQEFENYLAKKGASSLKDATRKICFHVITTELAQKLSWINTAAGKISIRTSNVAKALMGGIRKSSREPNTTLHEVEKHLSNLFKHSKKPAKTIVPKIDPESAME